MKINKDKILEIIASLDEIIKAANELEQRYSDKISRVHPDHTLSARNLVHYLALRQYDVSKLQQRLQNIGLTLFHRIEAHVMRSLLFYRLILSNLVKTEALAMPRATISFKKSRKLINKNAEELFGKQPKKRRTRIMVTMPSEIVTDPGGVKKFLKAGMNCARINCAHDQPEKWLQMIQIIRAASEADQPCRIMMDLSGPKLRTGPMITGPKVIRVKPEKDDMGFVTKPASLWLAANENTPPSGSHIHIPVSIGDAVKLTVNDFYHFTDARGKKCSMELVESHQNGYLMLTYDSAYINTGMEIFGSEDTGGDGVLATVGELEPVEQCIILKPGDRLILHNNPSEAGKPAKYDLQGKVMSHAAIACAMPDIFDKVKPGEPILFDDGKIEGTIEAVADDHLRVLILNAKETGTKLRAAKGINLPLSDLQIAGLTSKDLSDLQFIARHADAVNVSFVNDPGPVAFILNEFEKMGKQPGLVLKIETRRGFQNLPLILLEAMRVKNVGVMIARGDLAVETGWNDMAAIQEEILRICKSAHIPDIWATQVLENMAKKGIPSRAEITDAGFSERAECVMLNKGAQITKAIKLLDKILCTMEAVNKQEGSLPRLDMAGELLLK
jgi:pyruvate kinase